MWVASEGIIIVIVPSQNTRSECSSESAELVSDPASELAAGLDDTPAM